ncbi:uncharacterized protein LOC123310334 [Coccinella septempunctata]|uniref:uncharacterized protein LOC123310334 n=2 Tax=Coccinella septempunctata TaxID=41139 RepID=UPI001D08B310|nr:uncharacterized protein LOC123310334 [Coccinella septempunctata]
MPDCDTCTGSISSRSPGLKCSGCGKFFHAKCVNLSKGDVPRFQMPGVSWNCGGCRSGGDVHKRRSLAFPVHNVVEASPDSLSVLQNIQSEMKSLVAKYETLLESVNFCSDSVSSFERSMSAIDRMMVDMERITRENMQLKSTVKDLQERMEVLEQQSRVNNLEICGVPEKANENVSHIISRVAEVIGCPINSSDVDSFYRVPTFDISRPKPIVVKFTSKQKRDDFLGASKTKRRQSLQPNKGLKIENISDNLYINEHLTPKNKKLLKKTKEVTRSKNYKFAWTRNGFIFVRKDDRSRVVRVSSEEDLSKIV